MGERQRRLKWLLERDGYRCGIHLGGCGKKISQPSEANIGHILPRTVGQRLNLDAKFTRKIPRGSNFQPMHVRCNQKMGSVYPPVPLIQHCDCCQYIYVGKRNRKAQAMVSARELARKGHDVKLGAKNGKVYGFVDGIPAVSQFPRDPKIGDRAFLLIPDIQDRKENAYYPKEWRQVLPGDSDERWEWAADSVAFLRIMKGNDGAIDQIQFACSMPSIRVDYTDGTRTPRFWIMSGKTKDGRYRAGWDKDGKIGNLLMVDQMVVHNLRQGYREDTTHWSEGERRALESTKYGWTRKERPWAYEEFQGFGFTSVEPKSNFANKHPDLGSKTFIAVNQNAKQLIERS